MLASLWILDSEIRYITLRSNQRSSALDVAKLMIASARNCQSYSINFSILIFLFDDAKLQQPVLQYWFKEEYMTLQGRLDYSLPHNLKIKSHFKFIELDINVSQACQHFIARALLHG